MKQYSNDYLNICNRRDERGAGWSCPPRALLRTGAPNGPRYHHYVFELYALNANLEMRAEATRAQLLEAMKDTIVAKAAYVGRFKQKRTRRRKIRSCGR
jgi:phosphatidylethanolamine-binding protein (PEBP) family uncharacterized protein